MTQQIIQQMTICLKGGQTVVVPFNAEKSDVLNPQIKAFLKALGDNRILCCCGLVYTSQVFKSH